MPRLSIVIPAFRGTDSLEGGLVSVLENRPEDCEILVLNACGYADPYDLAGEVRFLATTQADQVAALNSALSESQGEFVHVLESGAKVVAGWADAALAAFAHDRIACVAPLVLSGEQGTIDSAGLDYQAAGAIVRRASGKPAGAAPPAGTVTAAPWGAGFYRRRALADSGLFDALMGVEYADVELGLRLAAAGWQTAYVPASRVQAPSPSAAATSWDRIQAGRRAERLFWRASSGLAAVAGHPLVAATETIRRAGQGATLHLAGRIWGALEWGDTVRYRRLLSELAHTVHGPAATPVAAPHFLQTQVAHRRAG